MSRMPTIAAMARPDRLMETPPTAKGQTAHRVEAQCADQDDSGNDQVAAVGKVHTVLDHIADTDCGDHAVQHKADAADDAGGDGVDNGLKLGAEAQDHSHHSGNADDQRIVDLAQASTPVFSP